MENNLFLRFRKNIPIIFILLAWSGFIFTLIGMPMEQGIETGITYFDKFVHFLLFGIEAELIFLLFHSLRFNKIRAFAYGFILTFSFALFSEYYQSYVPGRTASEFDLVAGIIGMLFFLIIIYLLSGQEGKPKLLLHICCAGCGAYVADLLKNEYDIYLFFSNSNIYPREEYERRKEDIKKLSNYLGLENQKIIYDDYSLLDWRKEIKGLESEIEGGKRCLKCFRYRFTQAAKAAKKNRIKYFTSTLSVSPHKNTDKINKIGRDVASEFALIFLSKNFKNDDGFKRSMQISKNLNIYRQNYCGCEYSIRLKTKKSNK